MILEQQKENLELNDGESSESIGMSLDMDSAFVLMQMLSKNLYSDPIGSTIRECVSNALDSHRRVDSIDPIVVSLETNGGNLEFTVEDFGAGLDANDVSNIISKYGKSTKRNSNKELGMMGLGFKSPLAYSSSFYFVCRKDGIERKYMMYEGEEGNKIDLLLENPTTSKNGVKVIVPIKFYDRSTFVTKIREQLAYFEGVYFKVLGLSNDFRITRHELFQISELASTSYLHLCLDNVYYPLDFAKLGIPTIQFPVALRCSLTDGIFPVPNREQLKYSQETITTIKKKIEALADYFVEKYNETCKTEANFKEYCDYYYNSSNRNVKVGSFTLNVYNLKQFSSKTFVEPKLQGIDILKMSDIVPNRDYFLREYRIGWFKNYQKYTEASRNDFLQTRHLDQKIFVYSKPIGNKLKAFIRDTYQTLVLFVKKDNKIPLFKPKGGSYSDAIYNWHSILKLDKYPKDTWRARIKEAHKVIEYLTADFIDLDTIKITTEWEQARKAERASNTKVRPSKDRKQLGEVVGKLAVNLERAVWNKTCKLESTNFKLDSAYKEKYTIVYDNVDNEQKVQNYFKVFNKNKVKFVLFSNRELKYLKDFKSHNWIKMEDFEKGQHAEFKRVVTSYLVEKLIEQYIEVFTRLGILKNVSSKLYDEMVLLNKYRDDHYHYAKVEVYESMVSVATEHKLFDYSVYPTYIKVKSTLEKLPFINSLLKRVVTKYGGSSTDVDDSFIQALRDLFKYHKQKIDLEYYKTVPEPVVEEVSTEVIEEWVA